MAKEPGRPLRSVEVESTPYDDCLLVHAAILRSMAFYNRRCGRFVGVCLAKVVGATVGLGNGGGYWVVDRMPMSCEPSMK